MDHHFLTYLTNLHMKSRYLTACLGLCTPPLDNKLRGSKPQRQHTLKQQGSFGKQLYRLAIYASKTPHNDDSNLGHWVAWGKSMA
jgi:hypothetical protein